MTEELRSTPEELRQIQLNFVEGFVQYGVDKTQLPSYRKLMRQIEREQRKLRAARVDGLLSILKVRDMRLTKAQERRLHAMPWADLPALKVAVQAKSVSDFARKLGLKIGRK